MIEFEVEPRNPAEVLAACGLFTLASLHEEAVKAQFTTDGTFQIDTGLPLEGLLDMLKPGQFRVADDLSWVTISGVRLNWWMREGREFKLWAGQVNPRNLVDELLRACEKVREEAGRGEFLSASVPLTKRFGADPRSSWVSLDIGYSPNDQGTGAVHTRPFAEIFSMVGLQTFLPRKKDQREYTYNLWQAMLPLLPARLAFAGISLPVPFQRYRYRVSKSGSFSVFNFSELEE